MKPPATTSDSLIRIRNELRSSALQREEVKGANALHRACTALLVAAFSPHELSEPERMARLAQVVGGMNLRSISQIAASTAVLLPN